MKALFTISRVSKKVWKPTWGNPIFFIFPILMVVFSIIFVAGGVRNWIGGIGYDSHILGAEFLTESDSDFLSIRDQHAELLRTYISSSESGFSSSLVRIVFPQFNLRDRFSETLENLEMAQTQREASLAISLAAEECVEFSESAMEFAGGPILSWGEKKTPTELWENLYKALQESEVSLNKFVNDPNLHNAENLCRKNRKAFLLTVLADNFRLIPEPVNRLYSYVQQSADNMIALMSTLGDPADRNYGMLYVQSETFRIGILDAMLNNDIEGAQALLHTAIKVAFKERERTLEFLHDYREEVPP